MENERNCPRCGASLPVDAPEGLCPKCLAQAGLGTEPGVPAGASELASAGAGPPPLTLEEMARHFPHLEILEVIGQGGMGIVYKARQPKLDRIVALKVLPVESGKDPAFAERFAREARALARLNHPNIVTVYDFGETDGLYYFLMEHVDGVNLRQMQDAQRLAPEQALAIVPKICDALQFAHEEGIVHRDIKPGNILIDKKGRLKIADFGLAKLLGKAPTDLTLTATRQFMGTPHYMAPEQIERPQQVDHRADIYSLGVVFYEMLTGELPVGRFAPPSSKVRVDVRLDDVVLRTLEKEPERRYQHASEVKTDLESIATSEPPQIPAEAAQPHLVGVPGESARAAKIVKAPAVGLLIYGIVNLATWAMPATMFLAKLSARTGDLRLVSPTGDLRLVLPPGLRFGPVEFSILSFWGLMGIAAAICMMIGANRMRNLSSYPWALAAAILAMLPVSAFWLIGVGLGTWALIVIHQHEVKAAFAAEPSGTARPSPSVPQAAAATDIPVFSRKAIAGAVLAVICLVMPLLALVVYLAPLTLVEGPGTPGPVLPGPRAGVGASFLFLVLIPVLLTGPVTATILGLVAIKDIRYSQGRIVGLPLALADALLFPLLVLDALVFGALYLAISGTQSLLVEATRMMPYDDSGVALLLVGVALCGWLDFRIIRASWRVARRPVL